MIAPVTTVVSAPKVSVPALTVVPPLKVLAPVLIVRPPAAVFASVPEPLMMPVPSVPRVMFFVTLSKLMDSDVTVPLTVGARPVALSLKTTAKPLAKSEAEPVDCCQFFGLAWVLTSQSWFSLPVQVKAPE